MLYHFFINHHEILGHIIYEIYNGNEAESGDKSLSDIDSGKLFICGILFPPPYRYLINSLSGVNANESLSSRKKNQPNHIQMNTILMDLFKLMIDYNSEKSYYIS